MSRSAFLSSGCPSAFLNAVGMLEESTSHPGGIAAQPPLRD